MTVLFSRLDQADLGRRGALAFECSAWRVTSAVIGWEVTAQPNNPSNGCSNDEAANGQDKYRRGEHGSRALNETSPPTGL